MEYKFSDKVSGLKASAIREILKFTADPEVISFAAGNPAPEAFPKERIADISAELLRDDPILALQYSVTEGYTPRREFLKGWMTELPPDRREKFCDAVYQILKDTDANTLRDIGRNKYSSLRKIILSIRSLDEQTRQDINYCLRLLLKSAKLGMVRMVQEK